MSVRKNFRAAAPCAFWEKFGSRNLAIFGLQTFLNRRGVPAFPKTGRICGVWQPAGISRAVPAPNIRRVYSPACAYRPIPQSALARRRRPGAPTLFQTARRGVRVSSGRTAFAAFQAACKIFLRPLQIACNISFKNMKNYRVLAFIGFSAYGSGILCGVKGKPDSVQAVGKIQMRLFTNVKSVGKRREVDWHF